MTALVKPLKPSRDPLMFRVHVFNDSQLLPAQTLLYAELRFASCGDHLESD